MKKWQIAADFEAVRGGEKLEDLIKQLLRNRGLKSKRQVEEFLQPPHPQQLTTRQVGINPQALEQAIKRIKLAVKRKESMVVYADYDADGITAGAIMWEALHELGAKVMPYIPHRVEEGYGLSIKGIDAVREQHDPTLIITVDHGITASAKVDYAQKQGMEVIVTDHHVKPNSLPDCTIVHTSALSGAGVAWFFVKELLRTTNPSGRGWGEELLALTAIGTIADMVPLIGPNRSLVKWGLTALNSTIRVGLLAIIADAGLTKGDIGPYHVSHILAPRLNAMGRLVHAMDALRLLCTRQSDKALLLARKLGLTNQQRQKMTEEMSLSAKNIVLAQGENLRRKKLLFVVDEQFNQGVIGLVAGRLVEEFYRPVVVVSKGETVSKASARSIAGFNIVEAIRRFADILIDVGGHPMAAGFTVETRHLTVLQQRLEALAEKELDEATLTRSLRVDAQISLSVISEQFWQKLSQFGPFGFGNPEPVFATRDVEVVDLRLVGNDGKHLKLRIKNKELGIMDAIGFGLGDMYGKLAPGQLIDIAYTIDVNFWNGNQRLQLKIKDIHFH